MSFAFFLSKTYENGDDINGVSAEGDVLLSPLHFAVLSRNLPALRFLHLRGAFPNRINERGESELHVSVVVGDAEVFSSLLLFGSDVTILNAKEESCYDIAKR